jgi:hypothetical protein
LGVTLAASGSAALASGRPTTLALKQAANWLFPLVPSVRSVQQAVALADAGITPLPAVLLPALPPHSTVSTPSSASEWAQATLDLLSNHSSVFANRSVMATMAVSIDACAYESESLHRAAAYWSVIYGAQALWYENLSKCAQIGTAKWKLIRDINLRLTQFAEPLFMKGISTPAWNGAFRRSNGPAGSTPSSDCRHGADCFSEELRYNVTRVFSTSTLRIPPLQGVQAAKPGMSKQDLIQSMDAELVVIELHNHSVEVGSSQVGVEFARAPQRYLLVLSTALSTAKGGSMPREVSIQLRGDVTSTQPIEPNAFQGFASVPGATANSYSPTPEQGIPPTFRGDRACPLSWIGNVMGSKAGSGQLRLPGGSVQLLTWTLQSDWAWPQSHATGTEEGAPERLLRESIGRRPPKRV